MLIVELPMRRVLFRWRGTMIYSYPAMLYLGMVLGTFAQRYAANVIRLSASRTALATLILMVPALIGARLLFVAANWRVYRRDPQRMWRRSEGGAAMYGGLFLAVPLSVPLLAGFGIPFGAFWDTASFAMLIGMIVARVGCLLNGCCSGRPTSGLLGLDLPDHHGVWRRRVPTQILEAIWGLVVLAGAIGLWGILPVRGQLFLYTVGAYGAGRIVLEPLRQEQDFVRGVPLHQTLSTAFVAVSLVGFAIAWLAWRRPPSARLTQMSDWLVLLTPLLLLPIVLLFIFVGCQVFFPVDEPEDTEDTGTTTGEGPAFISVGVELSAGCDTVANEIDILLTSDINVEHHGQNLTSIPPGGLKYETLDLHITQADEGQVSCQITVIPASGDPPPIQTASHDKIKDELVAPFTITCTEGGIAVS